MIEGIRENTYVLIKLLNKTGLSYNQIAVGAGLSYQKVMQIVSGDGDRVSLETVKKIQAFALSVVKGKEEL